MAFSPQFLDELRTRVGLADVVGKRTKLVRKGREHSGLCPFHKEKTPSFTVNEEKGFYHCFGCGAHGSIIDFLMETEGLTFPEAVERLAVQAGMEIPRDTPQERERQKRRQTLYDVTEGASAYFEKMLRMPEGRAGLEYLKKRGLSDETIKAFRLGFAPETRRGTPSGLKGALARDGIEENLMVEAGLLIRPDDKARDPYDRFRGRVMFPITDRRSKVVAFGGRIIGDGEPKYLNSPETPLFHKGHLLYGLAQAQAAARNVGTVIVTEGYMDVIALAQAGFHNAVAPLGTALTEDQLALLWKVVAEPVLCFDGDNAGQRAAARAAERALPLLKPGVGLRFALMPTGEDPDSLVSKGGPDAMQSVLDAASPLSEMLWQIETGGTLPASPEDRAALDGRLQDHVRAIQDTTVRAHFSRAFSERLWPNGGAPVPAAAPPPQAAAPQESYRPQPQRQQQQQSWSKPFSKKWPPEPPSVVTDANVVHGARVDRLLQEQKAMVALIINHPDMFHMVEDAFGASDILDASLNGLRQAVTMILSGHDTMDRETLLQTLRTEGQGEALKALYGDPLIIKHRQIAADAPFELVKEAWDDTQSVLANANLAADSRVGDDLDAETWQRKRAILNGKVGNED